MRRDTTQSVQLGKHRPWVERVEVVLEQAVELVDMALDSDVKVEEQGWVSTTPYFLDKRQHPTEGKMGCWTGGGGWEGKGEGAAGQGWCEGQVMGMKKHTGEQIGEEETVVRYLDIVRGCG